MFRKIEVRRDRYSEGRLSLDPSLGLTGPKTDPKTTFSAQETPNFTYYYRGKWLISRQGWSCPKGYETLALPLSYAGTQAIFDAKVHSAKCQGIKPRTSA